MQSLQNYASSKLPKQENTKNYNYNKRKKSLLKKKLLSKKINFHLNIFFKDNTNIILNIAQKL